LTGGDVHPIQRYSSIAAIGHGAKVILDGPALCPSSPSSNRRPLYTVLDELRRDLGITNSASTQKASTFCDSGTPLHARGHLVVKWRSDERRRIVRTILMLSQLVNALLWSKVRTRPRNDISRYS